MEPKEVFHKIFFLGLWVSFYMPLNSWNVQTEESMFGNPYLDILPYAEGRKDLHLINWLNTSLI